LDCTGSSVPNAVARFILTNRERASGAISFSMLLTSSLIVETEEAGEVLLFKVEFVIVVFVIVLLLFEIVLLFLVVNCRWSKGKPSQRQIQKKTRPIVLLAKNMNGVGPAEKVQQRRACPL
jgi:hypothetical protein